MSCPPIDDEWTPPIDTDAVADNTLPLPSFKFPILLTTADEVHSAYNSGCLLAARASSVFGININWFRI